MLVPEISKVQGEISCIAKNEPTHPRWRIPEVKRAEEKKKKQSDK